MSEYWHIVRKIAQAVRRQFPCHLDTDRRARAMQDMMADSGASLSVEAVLCPDVWHELDRLDAAAKEADHD